MTPRAKRQALLAGGVVAVLAGLVYTTRQGAPPAAAATAPSNPVAGGAQPGNMPVVDVQLELLKGVRTEAREPERLRWKQEVEESPFERILSESITELELAPGAAGGTEVSLTMRHRARGFARFGFIQLRAAAGKQVREALDGLAGVVEA